MVLMNRRKLMFSVPLLLGTTVGLSSCVIFRGDNNTGDETTVGPSDNGSDNSPYNVPPVNSQEIDGINYTMMPEFLSIGGGPTTENKLRIYEDLQCPYCKDLKIEISEHVQSLIASESLVVEFVVVNYLGVRSTNAWSENTANMLAVVSESQPEKFMEVQKTLYENQPDKRNTDPFTGAQLRKMVDSIIEFSEEEIKKIDDGYYVDWVNQVVNPFAAKNEVSSIPTVVWNETVLEDYGEIIDILAKL